MTIDEFWSLIEAAGRRARPGPMDSYMERYVAKLTGILRERSPEEVVAFRDHFQDRLYEAYNWDLWGAAEVIGQGFCSDDWFEDFRGWLISMGREVYEQALADPESLVEPASRPEVESCFFEDLLYVPYELYEEMTGTEIPDYPNPRNPLDPPSGTKLRDDDSDLQRDEPVHVVLLNHGGTGFRDLPERYPKLWARFGREPSPAPSMEEMAEFRREPPRHMDIDQFWHLIEEVGRYARPGTRDGTMERFVDRLTQLLRERSPEEVVDFSTHFEYRIRQAYTHDLWDAADLITQGFSEHGPLEWLEYFCGWLITLGREVYEQALADPDSLVEPASRLGVEDWHLDELLCAPERVYEEKMGTAMLDYPTDREYLTERRDDKPALPQRFPKLWARFGPRR